MCVLKRVRFGASATLRPQPASGAKCTKQAAKQAKVVRNPVECCCAENPIEAVFERKILQIRHDKMNSEAELWDQMVAGRHQHILG